MSNTTEQYFPPGVSCFTPQGGGVWDATVYDQNNCTVTPDMIAFLNITEQISSYFNAYCLNPPTDDSCPFGYCPQPDIAGPLVRISTYITTLCLSFLIFYSRSEVKDAFYCQLLTIYSLLVTTTISIFQKNLTRFHALMVSVIVCSPLSIYLNVYAFRAIWGDHQQRLHAVLGRGRIFNRILVLLNATIWLGLTIYSYLPLSMTHFTQESCKRRPVLSNFFLLTPISVGIDLGTEMPALVIAMVLPFVLLIIAWTVAILLRRKVIWPHSYRPNFAKVWKEVGEHFPFIHFLTVVALPFIYWVATIELGLINSNDNKFTLSFGQVLAVFVAVPPVVSVARLAPEWFHWAVNLTWVRRMTGRPKSPRFSSDGRESLLPLSGKGRSQSMGSIDDTPSMAGSKFAPPPIPMAEYGSDDSTKGKYTLVDGQ